MHKFCQAFPSIDQQILSYLNYIRECIDVYGKEQVDIAWLGLCLKEIYNSEIAKIMLQESQLENYVDINGTSRKIYI